ncbi:peptidoglycan binding protein CsiV [Vibrio sp. JC009]|uniref:peptidoglycan binding protein CsiV n=1 Tax=Vibrio sp. JC009 TaxID=2912314 RepID=UPI0023B1F1D6|nr:peptidoglycan binding protein CsiV [Vibrio sp. JC009]WED20810.1 peptidoglycan binding protein CsiV [Vibrio sp. JC009]
MKKLITLLLSLATFCTFAAEREFDVEVILFKRAVSPENVSESWPDQLPAIDLTKAATLNNSLYLEKKGVEMLPYEDYQLTNQKQKLDKHAGFTVLMHKAWRQGDQPKGSSPVFHIRAGRDFSKSFNSDGSVKIEQPVVADDITQETSIDQPIYELEGKFQVYVQHYLFLESDLDLRSPGKREIMIESSQPVATEDAMAVETDFNNEPLFIEESSTVEIGRMEAIKPVVKVEEFLRSYRLSQKRRMRSGEIHYLDHPLMGIIIQVRKAPVPPAS